mgnify:CR=1 FL=1
MEKPCTANGTSCFFDNYHGPPATHYSLCSLVNYELMVLSEKRTDVSEKRTVMLSDKRTLFVGKKGSRKNGISVGKRVLLHKFKPVGKMSLI